MSAVPVRKPLEYSRKLEKCPDVSAKLVFSIQILERIDKNASFFKSPSISELKLEASFQDLGNESFGGVTVWQALEMARQGERRLEEEVERLRTEVGYLKGELEIKSITNEKKDHLVLKQKEFEEKIGKERKEEALKNMDILKQKFDLEQSLVQEKDRNSQLTLLNQDLERKLKKISLENSMLAGSKDAFELERATFARKKQLLEKELSEQESKISDMNRKSEKMSREIEIMAKERAAIESEKEELSRMFLEHNQELKNSLSNALAEMKRSEDEYKTILKRKEAFEAEIHSLGDKLSQEQNKSKELALEKNKAFIEISALQRERETLSEKLSLESEELLRTKQLFLDEKSHLLAKIKDLQAEKETFFKEKEDFRIKERSNIEEFEKNNETIKKLTLETERLYLKLAGFEGENKESLIEKARNNERIHEFEERIRILNAEKEEIQKKCEEIGGFEEKIKVLSAEKEEIHKKYEKLELEITLERENFENAKENAMGQLLEVEELRMEIETLQKEKIDNETKLKEIQIELENAMVKLLDVEKLRIEIKEMKIEQETSEKAKENAKENAMVQLQEVEKLRMEIETLQRGNEAIEMKLMKEKEIIMCDMKKIEFQSQEQTTKIGRLLMEIEKMQKERETLLERLEEIREENKENMDLNAVLKGEKEELLREREEIMNKNGVLKEEIDDLLNKIEETKREKKEINNYNNVLTVEKEEILKKFEEITHKNKEITELNCVFERENAQLLSEKEEIIQKNKEIIELNGLLKAEKERLLKEKEISEGSKEIRIEDQNMKEEVEKLTQHNDHLQMENNTLLQEKSSLERDLKSLQKQNTDLQLSSSALEIQIIAYTNKVKHLQAELDSKPDLINESSSPKMCTFSVDVSPLNSSNLSKIEENNGFTLEKTNKDLESQVKSLRSEKNQLKSRVNFLIDEKNLLKIRISELEKQTESLNNYLNLTVTEAAELQKSQFFLEKKTKKTEKSLFLYVVLSFCLENFHRRNSVAIKQENAALKTEVWLLKEKINEKEEELEALNQRLLAKEADNTDLIEEMLIQKEEMEDILLKQKKLKILIFCQNFFRNILKFNIRGQFSDFSLAVASQVSNVENRLLVEIKNIEEKIGKMAVDMERLKGRTYELTEENEKIVKENENLKSLTNSQKLALKNHLELQKRAMFLEKQLKSLTETLENDASVEQKGLLFEILQEKKSIKTQKDKINEVEARVSRLLSEKSKTSTQI